MGISKYAFMQNGRLVPKCLSSPKLFWWRPLHKFNVRASPLLMKKDAGIIRLMILVRNARVQQLVKAQQNDECWTTKSKSKHGRPKNRGLFLCSHSFSRIQSLHEYGQLSKYGGAELTSFPLKEVKASLFVLQMGEHDGLDSYLIATSEIIFLAVGNALKMPVNSPKCLGNILVAPWKWSKSVLLVFL